MFKKVIAVAMVAVMVFTVVPAMNVSATSETTPTDLSRISKKPVLAYTFEGQDKYLILAGTAKVENGVLNLTPKTVADEAGSTAGYGENYAKIGSLAGYDFSKGFSLVFDLNFSTFTNEWTSPIVLGNGSLENRGTCKGQVGYHFNSGMSNIIDIGKSTTSGTDNDKYGVYGGGQIANPVYEPKGVREDYAPLAAPYTYDWFQYTDNHNKWYSFVVTITNTGDLKMYINGALIQDCPDDGYGSVKKIFDNVNNFTNNMLGATYWGPLGTDIDFQGKMDNVAFYNEVLTAKDASQLVNAYAKSTPTSWPTVKPTPTISPTPTLAPTATPGPTDNNKETPSGGSNSSNTDVQTSEKPIKKPETPFIKVGKIIKNGSLKYKVTKISGRSGNVSVVSGTNKKLKKIVIPQSIKENGVTFKITAIEKNAFRNYKKLSFLSIKSKTITKIGKNALKGTKKKMKIMVPTSKLKKYAKMIKKAR